MIRQAAATVVALCLSASPLHAQSAPNTKLTVSETSATVHKTPSVGSPVIGNAPRGTELVVTREVGDWVKVAWPASADGAGYVRKSALAHGAASPAVAKAPAASAAPVKAAAPRAATAKAAPATAKAEPAMAPVSAKAAITPTASVAPVAVREQIPVSQPSVPARANTQYVAPTHIFGVGAMAGSSLGFGGSARAWKKGRIGMQLEVSRYTYDSVDLLSRASVTDIAPGVLFALNDHVSDSLWLRPYVGAAAHFAHSSRTDLIFPDVTDSASTMGARVFVGGEMSLSSVPALALSVDVGYYHQPEPFVGFEPGGMGVSFAAHWYIK
jgi:Bacterial SH3 domain